MRGLGARHTWRLHAVALFSCSSVGLSVCMAVCLSTGSCFLLSSRLASCCYSFRLSVVNMATDVFVFAFFQWDILNWHFCIIFFVISLLSVIGMTQCSSLLVFHILFSLFNVFFISWYVSHFNTCFPSYSSDFVHWHISLVFSILFLFRN